MSDSKVQREAEEIIFENLKSKLKCDDLQSNVRILISKANNIWICPDFYSEEKHIIGEIHTHLGKLKSACNQRAPTDGFAEQNGRDAERPYIKSKNVFDKQTAT